MAQLNRIRQPARVVPANLFDAPAIKALIDPFAAADEMLPRPISDIIENLRDYKVVRAGDLVIGSAALHIMPPDTAEIRALAVATEWQRQGIGQDLVRRCLDEARTLGVPQVFTLTLRPEFFKKLGFVVSQRDRLTHKVWTECYKCPKYDRCDEIALTIDLDTYAIAP